MTWFQWVGAAMMAIGVLAAAVEAAGKGATGAAWVIILLAITMTSAVVTERRENSRTRDIVDACLRDGNAVRFQGGIYIGCFERTEGSTP